MCAIVRNFWVIPLDIRRSDNRDKTRCIWEMNTYDNKRDLKSHKTGRVVYIMMPLNLLQFDCAINEERLCPLSGSWVTSDCSVYLAPWRSGATGVATPHWGAWRLHRPCIDCKLKTSNYCSLSQYMVFWSTMQIFWTRSFKTLIYSL